MPTLHVLRVFTDESGEWGNPLGVFLDGGAVPEARRQAVAADLGFSETVYVDDAAAARVRIFTPAASCRSPATRWSGPAGCWRRPVRRRRHCGRRPAPSTPGRTAT
jgi:hypothetical protein